MLIASWRQRQPHKFPIIILSPDLRCEVRAGDFRETRNVQQNVTTNVWEAGKPSLIFFLNNVFIIILPNFRSMPALDVGTPVSRANFCFTCIIPKALFKENERPEILVFVFFHLLFVFIIPIHHLLLWLKNTEVE